MARSWELGICNETSGFLFSHHCEHPPEYECALCGRPVCQDHTHQDVGRVLCTTCARKHVRSGRSKTHYGGGYDDYDPYFYGGSVYGRSRGGFFYHDHDPNDFTEGDAAGLRAEADDDFENDMSAS